MLSKIRDISVLNRILAIYWLIVGIMFIIFSYAGSLHDGQSFMGYLQSNASGVATFLLGGVYLLQFFVFWSLKVQFFTKKNIYGIFLIILGIQQLLFYNILGAIICGVLYYFLPKELNTLKKAENTPLIITMSVLIALSLLVVWIRWNLA